MKDKIKKIAEKAGFVLFTPEEDPRTPIDWSCDYDVELQEFAKLIVQECVREMGKYTVVSFAIDGVKEQFGVE